MKRQWKLALCLLLAVVTLGSCSGQPTQTPQFAEVTQNLGPVVATAEPTDATVPNADTDAGGGSIFSANPYDVLPEDNDFDESDPIGEEDYVDPSLDGDEGVNYIAAADNTIYPYAGSTPIPLDPVDAPTPTPQPKLTFSYAPYTANLSSGSLTFEAPIGWLSDTSQTEVFILTEPDAQIKNNQACIINISAIPVTNNYSENNLRTEVNQRLDEISATNFSEWSPSLTATRFLMGSKGVYANYSGTLADGTQLGGRIHYVCIDRVLYGVEIVFPLAFREDYLNVFSQIRETIKRGG